MPVTYKWCLAEFQKVFLKTAVVPITDITIIAQYITFVLTKTWFVLACILTKLVTKTLLSCSCFLGNVGQNVQKYFWRQTAWICEQYRYNSRNFTETGSIQSYYWHSQTCYRGKLLTLRVIAICAQSCSHCSHYSTACYLFINITLLLLLPRDASAECGYEIAFVCLSVTIRYRVQIRWNSSKIISRPNSLRPMCSLTPNMGDLVQREHPQN